MPATKHEPCAGMIYKARYVAKTMGVKVPKLICRPDGPAYSVMQKNYSVVNTDTDQELWYGTAHCAIEARARAIMEYLELVGRSPRVVKKVPKRVHIAEAQAHHGVRKPSNRPKKKVDPEKVSYEAERFLDAPDRDPIYQGYFQEYLERLREDRNPDRVKVAEGEEDAAQAALAHALDQWKGEK